MIKIHNFHHKWFSMFHACCCRHLHLGMTTALLKMNIFNLCVSFSSLLLSSSSQHSQFPLNLDYIHTKKSRRKKNRNWNWRRKEENILIEFFICISGMCTIFFMHIKVFSLNKLMLELFSCGNISLNIGWRTYGDDKLYLKA